MCLFITPKRRGLFAYKINFGTIRSCSCSRILDEAAYVPPKSNNLQLPQDDSIASLIRPRLRQSVPIDAQFRRLLINETVRGVAYTGHVVVKKGALEGVSDVSQQGRPACDPKRRTSTLLLDWPHIKATFAFRASVSGIRILGLARVEFKPVFVKAELRAGVVTRFHVSPARTSNVVVSPLKGFVTTKKRLRTQLVHASKAALHPFLSTDARRALLVSLRNEENHIAISDLGC